MLGIEAAQKNLEDVATPLSAEEAEQDRPTSGRPYSYSAFQASSTRVPDEDVDEEVGAIVAALRAGGELNRDELGRRVNCRLWGPGRYRRALSAAMQRGEIRGTRRRNFVAS